MDGLVRESEEKWTDGRILQMTREGPGHHWQTVSIKTHDSRREIRKEIRKKRRRRRV